MELSSVLGRLCIHGDGDNPDQKTFSLLIYHFPRLRPTTTLWHAGITRRARLLNAGDEVARCRRIRACDSRLAASEAPSSPYPCNSEVCLWFFDAATSLAHSLSSALWVYLWQIIEPRGTWFQWRLLCFSGKSQRERALRRRQLSVEGGNGAELLPCSLAAIDQRFSCCATPTTARILPLPCPGINTKVRK